MANDALWLSEQDVASLLQLPEAIDAVVAGLRLEATGRGRTMEKTHVEWGSGHGLHAIGGEAAGVGFVGTKTWAHTPGGATPLLVLWDSESGRLRAVIEAFALGQLRTAAVSSVATRSLAREDAGELAIIGTGKQALAQVAAVAAVRPLARVRVFSPTAEHRSAFVVRLRAAGFDFDVEEARSVAEAVAGAAIVTTVTRAREPFLDGSIVAPGTHINAIGAITPERRELAADLVRRCSLIAADSADCARRLASELAGVEGVVPLSRIITERIERPSGAGPTLFKAMGLGLADVSVAIEVFRRAAAGGIGRPIPQPVPAKPELRGGS